MHPTNRNMLKILLVYLNYMAQLVLPDVYMSRLSTNELLWWQDNRLIITSAQMTWYILIQNDSWH